MTMPTNDHPLNILFVHATPCVRAYKEAVSLIKRGHTVHLVCQDPAAAPRLPEIVASVQYYRDLKHLAAILRGGSWDIVHCHNEPNEPTEVALANVSCPVIFDCHDFTGLRQQLTPEQAVTERRCFEDCDAVIHVSQGMVETAGERYRQRRTLMLPSYPATSEIPRVFRKKLPGNHLVYLGGLIDPGYPPYEYRNYLSFFVALVDAGVHVHVFPSHENLGRIQSYLALDRASELFHLHKKLPYAQLLETISRFQWGLTGFSFEGITEANRIRFLHNALPNKLFDYIFAGVCPVAVNADTAAGYVRDLGVGYAAKDAEDLVQIVTSREPLPPLEDLAAIDMDEQIKNLEALYRECIAAHVPGQASATVKPVDPETQGKLQSLLNMAAHYEQKGNQAKGRHYRELARELMTGS